MASTTDAFGDAVCDRSDRFLADVRTCTALLPVAMFRYGTDEFDDAVRNLDTRESACDEALRDIRTVLGEANPNATGVYLNAGAVMELYARIDAVPNATERFVRELQAVGPRLSEATVEHLTEMAALVARATRVLAEATADFVRSLVRPGPPAEVGERVDDVAEIESRCDGRKYDLVEAAFDRRETAEAAVVRDLVRSLDAACDAAEDAADHLLFVHAGA